MMGSVAAFVIGGPVTKNYQFEMEGKPKGCILGHAVLITFR
jgi:hypothetical protein